MAFYLCPRVPPPIPPQPLPPSISIHPLLKSSCPTVKKYDNNFRVKCQTPWVGPLPSPPRAIGALRALQLWKDSSTWIGMSNLDPGVSPLSAPLSLQWGGKRRDSGNEVGVWVPIFIGISIQQQQLFLFTKTCNRWLLFWLSNFL